MLNAEQIAKRRIPIEDVEMNLGRAGIWQCNYCNRRLSNETVFMRHQCETKRRAQELASPLGQAAYGYYREWMRMKKYSAPGALAFMESKFYRSFVNFTQLVIDANIAKPDRYIQLMVENDLQPPMWCNNNVYKVYMDWYDKLSDPIEVVQASINYLFDICEKEEVQLEDVFMHLGAQRVISLIRQRRLTPWLLFHSPKFGSLLKTLDKSQMSAFGTVVRADYWAERFQTEKAIVANIKLIVQEVGL